MIKKNGGNYKIHHKENDYHIHIFFLEYDEKLPRYFTNHHRFVWKRMDKHVLNDSKLFEKQEIRWFSERDLRTKKKEFRSFYQTIVEKIISESPQITEFLQNSKPTRRTRKILGGK